MNGRRTLYKGGVDVGITHGHAGIKRRRSHDNILWLVNSGREHVQCRTSGQVVQGDSGAGSWAAWWEVDIHRHLVGGRGVLYVQMRSEGAS